MKYFNRLSEAIECDCGDTINIDDEISSVEEDALFDGQSSESEENEIVCESCGAVYEIDISASVEVTHEVTDVRLKEPRWIVNAEGVIQYSLSSCTVGQKVEISDGIYQIGQYNYQVENGRLSSIHNAVITDEQLRLFA
jgi:uncharacterized protein YbaR (Trm112 family)